MFFELLSQNLLFYREWAYLKWFTIQPILKETANNAQNMKCLYVKCLKVKGFYVKYFSYKFFWPLKPNLVSFMWDDFRSIQETDKNVKNQKIIFWATESKSAVNFIWDDSMISSKFKKLTKNAQSCPFLCHVTYIEEISLNHTFSTSNI